MNLHSRPTAGTEYPAENPIRRQCLPLGPVAGVVDQEALPSPHNRIGDFGTGSPSDPNILAAVGTFMDTAKHEPTPHGTAQVSLAPLLSEAVDHQLQAIISLDVPRNTIHIDIDGSLTPRHPGSPARGHRKNPEAAGQLTHPRSRGQRRVRGVDHPRRAPDGSGSHCQPIRRTARSQPCVS